MAANEPVRKELSFIGRETELEQLNCLRAAGHRLITIVAPGGYGKTRLARSWLKQLSEQNGVMWHEVQLAPLSSYQRIPWATAEAVGLEPHESDDPWQQVAEFCNAHSAMVLHLDNFEHLLEGGRLVQELIGETNDLTVLVTSREPIGLNVEQVMPLQALPVEETNGTSFVPKQAAATELFADRTRLSQPAFILTEENRHQVNELCRILEGVPLAIELAAAWMDSYSLEDLKRELCNHLDLQSRDPEVAERHRSVNASCNWSYSLLNEYQQLAVRCLAVFRGGFTVEAAEAVLPSTDLVRVIDELAMKSWLARSLEGAVERINFRNEAIREYAYQKLLASNDFEVAIEAHCQFFASLLQLQAQSLDGSDQAVAVSVLGVELDNLYLAIDTACFREMNRELILLTRYLQEYLLKVSAALPCVDHYKHIAKFLSGKNLPEVESLAYIAMARSLTMLGEYDRAREYCRMALYSQSESAEMMRSVMENTLGELDRLTGDLTGARYHYNLAHDTAERRGDRPGMISSLFGLARVSETESRFVEANGLLADCLKQFRELGDLQGVARVLNSLGNVAYRQGQYDEAHAMHMEALEQRRKLKDRRGIAQSLNNLGNVEFCKQNFSYAWTLYSQSLELRTEIGDRFGMAASLNNLGNVEYCQHNYEDAARLHNDGLEIKRRIGDFLGCSYSLNNLGNIAYRQQDWNWAQQRLSEAIQIAQKVGSVECTLAPMALSCALLAKSGSYRAAAMLVAGVNQQLMQAGIALDPMDGGVFIEAQELISSELSEEDRADLARQGSEMTLDQLGELCLRSLKSLQLGN